MFSAAEHRRHGCVRHATSDISSRVRESRSATWTIFSASLNRSWPCYKLTDSLATSLSVSPRRSGGGPCSACGDFQPPRGWHVNVSSTGRIRWSLGRRVGSLSRPRVEISCHCTLLLSEFGRRPLWAIDREASVLESTSRCPIG